MAEYREALQPLTAGTGEQAAAKSTRILRELAPQLLHPRILSSPAFLTAAASSSSSSSALSNGSSLISLSNPNNAFVALASLRNSPLFNANAGANSKGKARAGASTSLHPSGLTAVDLRILEGVDRLLALPVPGSSSSKSADSANATRGLTRSGKARLLDTVTEEDEEELRSSTPASDNDEEEELVDLMQGFMATAPAAAQRKVARRRRRAGIGERALGLQDAGPSSSNRRRSVLPPASSSGRLSLLPEGEFAVESVESTPRRRVIRAKRRSSFVPGSIGTSLREDDQDGHLPVEEQLTRPELEQELKEIKLDKEGLAVRRKLVVKDLEELEARIKRLDDIRKDLGNKLLELKEEELELDDEFEGVTDRLSQLEAATAGRAIASTSSRRRKGPAFLPSEHDSLPPNVAFLTFPTSSSSPVIGLDFSEPYGLLVASTSAESGGGGVSVYDLTDGQEVGRLRGHRGQVKCLLVEDDLCITGGADGKISLWDLPTAVEEALPSEQFASTGGKKSVRIAPVPNKADEGRIKKRPGLGGRGKEYNADAEGDQMEDVFFSGTPSAKSGKKPSVNGDLAERLDRHEDDAKGDGAEKEEEEEWPLLPSPGAALRSYRAQQQQQTASASASGTDEEDYFEAESEQPVSTSRLRVLEGHSKDVTCISYEDTSLVSGSNDKTLRLWDLNTGQCVVTMDILWAISNPPPAPDEEGAEGAGEDSFASSPGAMDSPAKDASGAYPWSAGGAAQQPYMTPRTKRSSLSGLRRLSSQYGSLSSIASSPTTPTGVYAPSVGTPSLFPTSAWDTSAPDFVGGLQLWSYALASGSADGCVRMWDTRTGQAVRSLVGHTGAVTALQFDAQHLVSGSADATVRVWDLRTGRAIDKLKYDGAVTDLQFDSRRILVANKGSDAVAVYNRTTLRQTELSANGHQGPVNRLRFMDRYLATGGEDGMVKVWSLA